MRARLRTGAAAFYCAALLASTCRAQTADLPHAISGLVSSSATLQQASFGIQIVNLRSGRTVYEVNPGKLFVPASNTKLFTTALALTKLGPDFTFQTRVLAATAPDSEGRVRGPLILAGGGDPNLSGRTLPYHVNSPPGDPMTAIRDLATQISARGVKRVDGGIVGDDTWYVWEPYADGWTIDDPRSGDGAPVSALALNDNVITLTVKPGAHGGDPAELISSPALEYFGIDNRIRTGPAGSERRINMERDPGGLQVRLWGSIPVRDAGESLELGIEDPARNAAVALREALEALGIAVDGEAVSRHLDQNEVVDLKGGAATAEPAGVELARRISAPLIEDLRVTDKVSQNLHAEMALRAVARARRGIGSLEAGLEELKAFLGEAGIGPDGVRLSDASGLARRNLVTPEAVVSLLRYMYASPLRETWLSLLPVAGQDGTLATRLTGSAVAGRIYAKTGTLFGVSALSGYARRANGDMLAFSILVNNFGRPPAEIRDAMDRICALMVE